MAAPIPTRYADGKGVTSGDQLNTFVQTATNYAQARTVIGAPGMQLQIEGKTTIADGGQGLFYWNPTAVGPDNNSSIIVPNGAAAGAWIKYPLNAIVSGAQIPVSLFGEALGQSFTAQQNSAYINSAPAGYGRIGYSFSMTAAGSGAIGPLNSDYAASFTTIKENYSGAALAGELDSVYITCIQGGPNSDATCFIAQTTQYGTGFSAVFEGATVAFASNVETYRVDVQCGVVDTRAGNQYGIVSTINTGTGTCAFQAQGVTPGFWSSYFRGINADGIVFDVDGNGNLTATSGSFNGVAGGASVNAQYGNYAGVNIQGIAGAGSATAGLLIKALSTTGYLAAFYCASAQVGSITTNGSSVAYNTTSDRRLKDLIGTADGQEIAKLKVYKGTFKSTPGIIQTFMIADEIEQVIPSVVHGAKDAVDEKGAIIPQMVDYSKFVPALIAYAQGLEKRLAALEASGKAKAP